jgi:hypothetical protein
MYVSEKRVTMLADNNGFQVLPERFEGEIIDRDVTAIAPPNAWAWSGGFQCRDGSILLQVSPIRVEGRFTEDGREMTATMQESWGQSPDSADVTLTWTWRAVRK